MSRTAKRAGAPRCVHVHTNHSQKAGPLFSRSTGNGPAFFIIVSRSQEKCLPSCTAWPPRAASILAPAFFRCLPRLVPPAPPHRSLSLKEEAL